ALTFTSRPTRTPRDRTILRLSLAAALLLFAGPARAQEKGSVTGRVQEKGSVAGRVVDKRTGHAIPFATVTVIGAQRGALTNSEGDFLIAGVPAGTWEVKVQFLGYQPASPTGVVVNAGKSAVV